MLEIGTGSGYQCAVIAMIGYEPSTRWSVSRNLSQKAQEVIKKLGLKNIKFKVGDGTLGWKEEAPFDGIIVTAGAPICSRNTDLEQL